MSKPRKKKLKITPPTSKLEAEQMLAKLGDLHFEAFALKAASDREISALAANYAETVTPIAEQAAAVQAALRKWADKNRDTLLEEHGGKTVMLTTGVIAWRDGPEAVLIEEGHEEETICALLQARGFRDCVRVTTKLDKDAIKKAWPEICDSRMRGLLLAQTEFFRLHPLQLAEPIDVKTKAVNIVDRLDGKPRKRSAA